MKRFIKNINNRKKIHLVFLLLFTLGLTFSSCKDDNDIIETGTDVKFGLTNKNSEGVEYDVPMADDYICSFKKGGGAQYFYVESNVGQWTLAAEEGYEKFVQIWPKEGKNDGRFGVKVLVNPTAYEQSFSVNLKNAAGKVMGKIPFFIEPSDPFLTINYSTTPKYVASVGEKFAVKVQSNIAWQATTDSEWIQIKEATDSTQNIEVMTNPGSLRNGSITFSMIGVEEEVKMYLRQLDLASDFAQAKKITITDLMSRLDAAGLGAIEDNVYVEGYVISDKNSVALKKSQMVVQDESNKGVWIEFSNDEDNSYNLNDKVKIHMYGASFVKDASTKASRVESFSPSFVHDVTPSNGIKPIEISELVNLNQYENVLVTLKEVEFPLPFGTYVNIVESAYNTKPANWTATAEPFADDTDDYGHLIRDRYGNAMKMYTAPSFLDRFKITMPAGSGSLTGIMMKRIKNNKTNYIIRIRNNEDNKVSREKGSALSRDIMQLGPWPVRGDWPAITASVGTGTLKFSGRPNQNTSSASTPDAIYFASSQARMAPVDLKPDGSPLVAYNNDLSYWGVNTQYWWGNPSSSISGGSSGEAWIISTSTQSATGSGALYLQFASSSSTTGPAHFDVEWSESESTPFNQWKKITEYTVCDINNSQHLMQYMFKLPEEMKGKSTVVIRLRVNSSQRATLSSSSIGTSGTNRLGIVRITQLKY